MSSAKNKEKVSIKTIIVFIILAVIIVGYFLYLMNKSKNTEVIVEKTDIEKLLDMDLENSYPKSPRDVIDIHSQITQYLYSGKVTDEQIEALNEMDRTMWSNEFLVANPISSQLSSLKSDVSSYELNDKKILKYSLTEVSRVLYYDENGIELESRSGAVTAVLYGIYSMQKGTNFYNIVHKYLVVKEDKKWKIKGWQDSTLKEAGEE